MRPARPLSCTQSLCSAINCKLKFHVTHTTGHKEVQMLSGTSCICLGKKASTECSQSRSAQAFANTTYLIRILYVYQVIEVHHPIECLSRIPWICCIAVFAQSIRVLFTLCPPYHAQLPKALAPDGYITTCKAGPHKWLACPRM